MLKDSLYSIEIQIITLFFSEIYSVFNRLFLSLHISE